MSAPEDRFGEAVHDALHDDGEIAAVPGPLQPGRRQHRRRPTTPTTPSHRRPALGGRRGPRHDRRPHPHAHATSKESWPCPGGSSSSQPPPSSSRIALWLGPFIKRFGRAYAADVFHDNPLTGKSYIVLTDVVYYLIFTAYILFTVHFEPPEDWRSFVGNVTASQLQWEVMRVGGILLIIGILHGLNIVLMPVLGRLFSLNRRLPPGSVPRRLQSDDRRALDLPTGRGAGAGGRRRQPGVTRSGAGRVSRR